MPLDLIPFQPDHLPHAAELFAERWRTYRLSMPLLPACFEQPVAAQQAIEAVLKRPRTSGVAALRKGRFAGYLIGNEVIEPPWGRTAWVRLGGCAIAPDESADIIGDLYTVLGQRWVADGCFDHFAQTPAMNPELVRAWFGLGFGIEQVNALAAVDVPRPNAQWPVGLKIRRAESQDKETLAAMCHLVRDQMTAAPVWAAALPEAADEIRAGYAEMVDDADATVWLAFLEGRTVGFLVMHDEKPSEDAMLVGEACAGLSIAATVEDARGRGVNTALTLHALEDARVRGKLTCLIDWRSANLVAARFWPRFGFQPVRLRLARRVDSRIAWANGRMSPSS